ncbi:MAG TPA: ribosomal protein S18-alanine N-acetyltransferase [Gemmatimonadales bacterium]
MADRFRIRAAAEADLEQVAAIERDVFSDPWSARSFLPLLKPDALVAEAGGRIVGYLFSRSAADEAEVLNLAVAPEYRRAGLGRRLLETVIDRWKTRGLKRVYLEVRASNEPAQAFYQALGFGPSGVRRGYYSRPPEDALVLTRSLQSEGRE